MNLVNIASQYYRTTISIFLFIILSGSLVFNNIPKESSPDVNLPYIYVSLGLTGISPEDSEKLLIKPVEDEISNIEGKKEMTSTSYQSGGNILLEFNAGFDPDQALLDTREQVDRAKSDLPDDADEPKVSEVNISLFPILVVSISGDASEFLLKKISNDLKDKIQSLPNVLEVEIGGEREEQLDIIIDQNKIEAYGLNLNEILSFVRSNNQVVSAGNLDTGDGRFVIKIPGLYENLNDIFNTPIKVNDKKTIKFKDIASLKRTFKDPEKFARLNDQSAFTLEISKRIGANIVETVNQVRALVAEEQKSLPSKINITFSGDESINIKNMLGDLQNNVIFSILLVMSVVIIFLGIRSSLLVGLAVPGSFEEFLYTPFNIDNFFYFIEKKGLISIFNPITSEISWETDISSPIVDYFIDDEKNLFILTFNKIFIFSSQGYLQKEIAHSQENPFSFWTDGENLFLANQDGISVINFKGELINSVKAKFTDFLKFFESNNQYYFVDSRNLYTLSE
jgi:multidrug efflux pump